MAQRATTGDDHQAGTPVSENLDKLLRETRRRLYAAAAASDRDILADVQTLPDSEIDAMERRLRGGLRNAELDHRRAVARLMSADTPLPFADAATEFFAPEPTTVSQYSTDAVSAQMRSEVFQQSLNVPGLADLGFTKGMPVVEPPTMSANPGDMLLVVSENGRAEDGVSVATRIDARLDTPSRIVLAGARTVNPGSHTRVRSAEELTELRGEFPADVLIVCLVNSRVPSHQRNANRLVENHDFNQVWVCVDARADAGQITRTVTDLPGEAIATHVAANHAWEARQPGNVLQTGVPVVLIDGAPASTALWSLVAQDAHDRLIRHSS
ncbi:MAG: hypothetical protein Q4P05_04805 [Actinomycetaceae bacterium]|nr:hypothetical protein [Actinomycetaceae bacterium]